MREVQGSITVRVELTQCCQCCYVSWSSRLCYLGAKVRKSTPPLSDGGNISEVGGAKINDQISFANNQGRIYTMRGSRLLITLIRRAKEKVFTSSAVLFSLKISVKSKKKKFTRSQMPCFAPHKQNFKDNIPGFALSSFLGFNFDGRPISFQIYLCRGITVEWSRKSGPHLKKSGAARFRRLCRHSLHASNFKRRTFCYRLLYALNIRIVSSVSSTGVVQLSSTRAGW